MDLSAIFGSLSLGSEVMGDLGILAFVISISLAITAILVSL